MPSSPKIWWSRDWPSYRAGFSKIDRHLEGIEWATAKLLYALWASTAAFLLRIFFARFIRENLIVDLYVPASVVFAIVVWLTPNRPLAWICTYFLFSTVVVLLHVVLLSKVFGDVISAERSLILFMLNVVQLIFTFSIWYELEGGQPKGKALFNALLVFATVGYPPEARFIVGIQIATDFLLLAIFLAHIVGRVGYRENRPKK